jgi:hypothetical protein
MEINWRGLSLRAATQKLSPAAKLLCRWLAHGADRASLPGGIQAPRGLTPAIKRIYVCCTALLGARQNRRARQYVTYA